MPASCKSRRLLASLALLGMLLCSLPGQAEAVDLRKRFGLGFNNNFSSFTSLSVKFGMPTPKPTVNIQVQGLGHMELVEDPYVYGLLLRELKGRPMDAAAGPVADWDDRHAALRRQ